jgi:putative transposase
MSRSGSPVSGKPYGLAAVCRAWRLARSGVYRHRAPAPVTAPQRRGPVGAMPDAALLAAIRAVLAASPFHGEGHRKVWAELASRFRQRSWWNGQRRVGYAMVGPGRRCGGCCG